MFAIPRILNVQTSYISDYRSYANWKRRSSNSDPLISRTLTRLQQNWLSMFSEKQLSIIEKKFTW